MSCIKNTDTSLPCKLDTISTMSSYTIKVAVLSGSRSRLMEENTRRVTKQNRVHAALIDRIIHYKIRTIQTTSPLYWPSSDISHKASFNIFNRHAFILSAVQDRSLTQQTTLLSSSFLPFTPSLFRAGKRDNPIGRRSVGL